MLGFGHGILRLGVRMLSSGLRYVLGICEYGGFKHYFIQILLFLFLLLIIFNVVSLVAVTFISDFL